MRLAICLTAASTLALASCADSDPAAGELNASNVAVAENAAANLGEAAAAPSQGLPFTGGDGASLGSVTVEEGPGGLVIRLAGTGMPAGSHGLHIHMTGKCEGPKFESAGAHWNPDSKQHGVENPEGPHRGDLPNVTVGADGTLNQELNVAGVSMAELRDADGSALLVHAKPDDNKTDPSGNSGDRIACAVIAPAS